MNKMKFLCVSCLVVLAVMMASCTSAEEKLLNRFEKIVTEVEKRADTLSEEQWKKYDDQVEDVVEDVRESLSKFSKEQREKLGNLYGRYVKVRMKAGISAYKENFDNAMDVANGFLDEVGNEVSSATEEILNATSEKTEEMLERLDREDEDVD